MSRLVEKYIDLTEEDRELSEKGVTALDLKRSYTRIETLEKKHAELIAKLDDPRGYGQQLERAEARLSDRIDELRERLRVLGMPAPVDSSYGGTLIPVEASTVKIEGEVS